jgi:hypothetical protein
MELHVASGKQGAKVRWLISYLPVTRTTMAGKDHLTGRAEPLRNEDSIATTRLGLRFI